VVTGDELRETMRRFAAGVCVVTAKVDDQRFGVTVGSLVSLSLEPPLIGIAIGHQSSFHEPLRLAGRFAVSLLAADQERLARHFARSGVPPVALWAGIPTRASALAEPLLADALAWLECRTRAQHEAGDHTIFVGDVLSTELGREADALVYLRGAYTGA
jgi:flavin reductase (DIM6/NTAB) family NADH-FMN oxidoreductase RutF